MKYCIVVELSGEQLDYLSNLAAENGISFELATFGGSEEEERVGKTPLLDEHIISIARATGRSLSELLQLKEEYSIQTLEDILLLEAPQDILEAVESLI